MFAYGLDMISIQIKIFESLLSISYVALEKDNFYVAAKEGFKIRSISSFLFFICGTIEIN